MPTRLPQPLLVAGVALPLTVLLFEQAGEHLGSLLFWGIMAVAVLGIPLALLKNQRSSPTAPAQPSPPSPVQVQETLSATQQLLHQIRAEAVQGETLSSGISSKVTAIANDLSREEFRIAIAGSKAVGKTALLNLLQRQWLPLCSRRCHLIELTGLSTSATLDADLVIFLIQGDLTQSELTAIQALQSRCRTLVVWNKQDQYSPAERQRVWQQIQQRLQGVLPSLDLLAIATVPQAIQIQHHQTDGSVQTWLDYPTPQITPLLDRLNQILSQEAGVLILQQTLNAALEVRSEARLVLNQTRRERALPIIERYQWITAATAFANPLPSLDLLAAAVINGKMVLELGEIYQQRLSLRQAQAIAATLASLLLKLGLVELSTQALTTLLKSNSLTYVAGGAIQGLSAAYLTRIAGLGLIEHFQTFSAAAPGEVTSPASLDKLSNILRQLFQDQQRADILKSFFQQAISRLPLPGILSTAAEPTLLPAAYPVTLPATRSDSVADSSP